VSFEVSSQIVQHISYGGASEEASRNVKHTLIHSIASRRRDASRDNVLPTPRMSLSDIHATVAIAKDELHQLTSNTQVETR